MKKTLLAVGTLVSALVLAFAAFSQAATKPASCSVTPNPATLGETITVSASGLSPGKEVNRIETFPDGAKSTMRVDVGTDGTYSGTEVAGWYGNQTGDYTIQFVSKVSWPTGDFKTVYATCTFTVN